MGVGLVLKAMAETVNLQEPAGRRGMCIRQKTEHWQSNVRFDVLREGKAPCLTGQCLWCPPPSRRSARTSSKLHSHLGVMRRAGNGKGQSHLVAPGPLAARPEPVRRSRKSTGPARRMPRALEGWVPGASLAVQRDRGSP